MGLKPYKSNEVNRQYSKDYLWSLNCLSKAFLGEIIEPKNGEFCHIFKFASDVFNSHGQIIVFPK